MSDDGTKLLVVDDDEMNGMLLLKRLEKRGFRCQYASSAEECYAALKLSHFDLVLLDIMMPDVS